jgi:uncharacterized protein
MKILVKEVTESPKALNFAESVEELNQIYTDGEYHEFRFPPSVDVRLVYYRSGREILFNGFFHGLVEATCSRCLAPHAFVVEKQFEFVLAPELMAPGGSKELNEGEMGMSFYQGAEINLAPLIREQVLLALPIRPLCREQCLGLCAGCGANLNTESCVCAHSKDDERLAVFRSLRVHR